MDLARWHRQFLNEGPKGFIDLLVGCLLFPLGILFGLIAKIRVGLYRSGWFSSCRFRIPVISVGNLAVGGTGKTPVVDLLLRHLLGKGITVAVVSRGYGRRSSESVTVVCAGSGPIVSAETGGDEPVLLAQRNPSAIIIVASARKEGIKLAVAEHGAELILLDDGYQHLQVRRDLDILLLDAKKPFGNRFPLPFGLLREFPSALNRADIVLLTRSHSGDESVPVDSKPVLHLYYTLAGAAIDARGNRTELQSLKPGRIGAFAGIANPDSFFASLKSTGLNLSETLSFNDHVVYSADERPLLHGLASRCDVLLTTEKDLVKLHDMTLPCDCLAVPLELTFDDTSASLTSLVDSFLDKNKEGNMLSDELIEILACPKCKGVVRYDQANEKITCDACKLAYPVRDGIPVMLVDEAESV